jgi:hypothetical protein
MTAHPTWCDPNECTALDTSDLGVQRGGVHRSTVVDLQKIAEISSHWGPLTAQLQQASRPWPTPVTLHLATGGDPIQLTLDPHEGLGLLLAQALQ